MRTLVTLACTECKRRNYTTKKNKQNNPDRLEFNKYCKWCGKPHGASAKLVRGSGLESGTGQ